MRKTKRHIPPEFLPTRNRAVGSYVYGFTKNLTLVSFVPKRYRAVILLSSMHHSKATDLETGKPKIIMDYNMTKGGVDPLDEKCTMYSSSRRTRRWSMALFYKILDISTVNAFVMYKCYRDNRTIKRKDFMKELAQSLIHPHMRRRYENPRIPLEIRDSIKLSFV